MEVSHLLLLSILPAVMDKGLCLVCYCKHSRLCVGDEDVCDGANDVCFTRILANGTYEYACLGVENDPFYTIEVNKCLSKKYSERFEGLICCNDRDRCNEDLRPPPPSKQSVTMETLAGSGADKTRESDDNRNQIYIDLTIAIPVLALILIAVIVTTALIYFLHCEKKRQAGVPSSSSMVQVNLDL